MWKGKDVRCHPVPWSDRFDRGAVPGKRGFPPEAWSGCGIETAPDQMSAMGVEKYEDKFEALKVADVVIVQMPLIEGVTNNTIAKAELDAMKPTALLVNCSRGEIVNEPDLCAALRSGSIAGAGLDVFWNEPTHVDDEILSCPNVIVSPHSAAQTREAVIKMATMCVNGCLAVCKGKKWPYVADKAVYDHPRWAGADWAEG